MKRIACLLLVVALSGTGCLGVQNVQAPALPPPPPVSPPPPPVLAGQVTESNAAQILQALNDEISHAATEQPVSGAPAVPPAPPLLPLH
jgi:hypothetical protein